jgi:hypothetical protein
MVELLTTLRETENPGINPELAPRRLSWRKAKVD